MKNNLEILSLSISELKSYYKSGDLTPLEVSIEYLKRIKEIEPEIDAFIEVFEEEALKEAEKLTKLKKFDMPLYGIPIAIKDNINVKGHETKASSNILKGYKSTFDATVVERLKDAGAIILGKTNLDEFAMGSSTENSAFKLTKNPYSKEFVPGGSSGGSAAAVSAKEALVSLGSDTGGSVRQPAAFCGVYGLRPTYGLVSRYGLIAFASSLDQIGPIGRNLNDLFLLLSTIAGKDNLDSTTLAIKSYNDLPDETLIGKFATIKEFEDITIDREIFERYEEVKKLLMEKFTITQYSFPHYNYALPAYHIIADSEASSNLSRFDGIRYGARDNANSFEDTINSTRTSNFGKEVKRRILLGTFALSQGYIDKFYKKALLARNIISRELTSILNEVDFILAPTTPTLPFKFGEKKDPLKMYYSDIFTIPSSLAGLPSINIPAGLSDSGLPVGIQVIGSKLSEKKLYKISKYIKEELNV
ncbi:MAG: Asp-tRNA(Asn)/Glu-tRNA(Gln) amidotransferase subunit GatA [Caldisericia bacterium]|jgi:aspartyl-tRNA(Asn)/glutamyl-tRNA(Gln) amidotransferase subunit A|nr:Asp-tRNA(Asn)/Glu-tRNA(Gln) amidotransferase subunit GatA [Caldisericia bacterium]HOJ16076.1 Asp-tRNA(Asn)/Glu-tRNA(Gln) amidotransferase subunit GatA [Caldisericia bacterium]HOW02708.1 Asp-tRNA(Asn)/Glu-tRNA(Gln) amidotransferase subunit GatA [Caldisericia bacterium]HPO29006.1 Asp-tRNA(Asn)/Glu-tRNA(Gln) amidotransferase subunit GatA [Caldisericia bacterium]HQG81862.1 Asp-tRNA(Asn)/Glu-tRNA(Gln) amidotransferase subunit GatA [Caldisericia bacterium]